MQTQNTVTLVFHAREIQIISKEAKIVGMNFFAVHAMQASMY